MDAIALALSDVPLHLVQEHDLARRIHQRGGEDELRFFRRARPALLPVWHAGQLRMAAWGSSEGPLPRGGLTWLKTVQAGEWGPYGAVPVEVPAAAGLHGGVWYRIRRGVRGVLVEQPCLAVYLIVEPASHYYRVMTRCDQMPVLLGEQI